MKNYTSRMTKQLIKEIVDITIIMSLVKTFRKIIFYRDSLLIGYMLSYK